MAAANDVNNMKAANQTYASFISAVKWSTPLVALIAAFVVYLIS